jgi:hypothetical protein
VSRTESSGRGEETERGEGHMEWINSQDRTAGFELRPGEADVQSSRGSNEKGKCKVKKVMIASNGARSWDGTAFARFRDNQVEAPARTRKRRLCRSTEEFVRYARNTRNEWMKRVSGREQKRTSDRVEGTEEEITSTRRQKGGELSPAARSGDSGRPTRL